MTSGDQRDTYLAEMHHRACCLAGFVLMSAWTTRLDAQQWLAGTDIPLIRRAAITRTVRDADSMVNRWRASAHGMVRYSSILQHNGDPIERVVREDELRVEVYGQAPNLSKQIIQAWRDTSFLPNHVDYHRDHLGIVANDFGEVIRLGQGDEVRDVPHPLSQTGITHYQFALGDTVAIAGPAGKVRVVTAQVRPAGDSAGAVGTLYIDVDRAALVRFAFTFTAASYRDPTVETITVVLENALEANTRWLPWRQSIVIHRAVPLLAFPLETVIRADWTIDDYQLGVSLPMQRFAGPPIEGPRQPFGGAWDHPIPPLDLLPASQADVNAITQQAGEALIRQRVDAMPRWRLLGDSISDFFQVNRVAGVTLGFGSRITPAAALGLDLHGAYGFSDHRVQARASANLRAGTSTISLRVEHALHDIGDEPVISGLANSLATLIAGDDLGDYSLIDRATVQVKLRGSHLDHALELGVERSGAVVTRFNPIAGSTAINPSLGSGAHLLLRDDIDWRHGRWGIATSSELGLGDSSWLRERLTGSGGMAAGPGELRFSATVAWGSSELPAYRSFVLGGRGTLLGVPFRSLGGRTGWLATTGWDFPIRVPSPRIPGTRYAPLRSTIGPFLAAGAVSGQIAGTPWAATGRVETVAGVRLDLWGPVARIETGISIRTGLASVSVDVHPDWWAIF